MRGGECLKVAALLSGGKDSVYAAYVAMQQGWEVARFVTLVPANPSSYMFHHPNVSLARLQAKAAGIPHREVKTAGEKEKELSDLKRALSGLGVSGVVSGAIESEYQKERVDFTCQELGLKSFAPLWRKPQERLAFEEARELDSVIVSVSAEGLGMEWLGRKFDGECVRELAKLKGKSGISVCGEGGEFETLVLDAHFFGKRLEIVEAETEWRGTGGVLRVKEARLAGKRRAER
jgi:ABC transporter with metal-binding/Fe-S-binding domain ATP-binding protein